MYVLCSLFFCSLFSRTLSIDSFLEEVQTVTFASTRGYNAFKSCGYGLNAGSLVNVNLKWLICHNMWLNFLYKMQLLTACTSLIVQNLNAVILTNFFCVILVVNLKVHECRFENLSICSCSYKRNTLNISHS